MEKEPKPFSEEKAEAIMAETKETTGVDQKGMSGERSETYDAGRESVAVDAEKTSRRIEHLQMYNTQILALTILRIYAVLSDNCGYKRKAVRDYRG